MTWQNTADWPSKAERAFRAEAVQVEAEFEVPGLGFTRRLLSVVHHARAPLARRFCLTTTHLYAELADGARKRIARSEINALEIHGAQLAIGTRTAEVSLVHFARPDEANKQLLFALAPERPFTIDRGNSLRALGFSAPLVVLQNWLASESLLTSESLSVTRVFALALAPAIVAVFLAVRTMTTVIDTRGKVQSSLIGTKVESVRRAKQTNETTSLPRLAHKTNARWGIVALMYVMCQAVLGCAVGSAYVLLMHEPVPTPLVSMLTPITLILPLAFLSAPKRFQLGLHYIKFKRGLFRGNRTVSLAKEAVCLVISGRQTRIVVCNDAKPVQIPLSDFEQDNAAARRLARALAFHWMVPLFEPDVTKHSDNTQNS